MKTADEAPTIGIVLRHRENGALVELTLPENSNIYASIVQLGGAVRFYHHFGVILILVGRDQDYL